MFVMYSQSKLILRRKQKNKVVEILADIEIPSRSRCHLFKLGGLLLNLRIFLTLCFSVTPYQHSKLRRVVELSAHYIHSRPQVLTLFLVMFYKTEICLNRLSSIFIRVSYMF